MREIQLFQEPMGLQCVGARMCTLHVRILVPDLACPKP